MNHLDLIRPKHCAKCKKLFFRGGKKSIRGDMRHTRLIIEYVCERC